MLHASFWLAWSLCKIQDLESLGEFRQGLYAGTMVHGACLRLRLQDVSDQVGRVWGTLWGFDPKGPLPVRGELTGTRITLSEVRDGHDPVLLAEGTVVAEDEFEGRHARFEIRFAGRPPLPAAPADTVLGWIAQLNHDDPVLRQEAMGALRRVGAEEAMRRALERSRSSEVRARLSDILEERVVFRQVSWDHTAEMTLNRSIRTQCRFPAMVSGPASVKGAMTKLKDEAFERCLSEGRAFAKELEDENAGPRSRSYEEDWELTLASGPMVSVCGRVSSYGGGAHSNYHFRTETLWLEGEEVRPVRLSELFGSCTYWESRLSSRVLEGLRQSGASLVVNGSVTELEERDLSTWCLTSTGVEFLFAPYAFGCFAEGSYAVEVPYSQLSDLLSEEGPASHLPLRRE